MLTLSTSHTHGYSKVDSACSHVGELVGSAVGKTYLFPSEFARRQCTKVREDRPDVMSSDQNDERKATKGGHVRMHPAKDHANSTLKNRHIHIHVLRCIQVSSFFCGVKNQERISYSLLVSPLFDSVRFFATFVDGPEGITHDVAIHPVPFSPFFYFFFPVRCFLGVLSPIGVVLTLLILLACLFASFVPGAREMTASSPPTTTKHAVFLFDAIGQHHLTHGGTQSVQLFVHSHTSGWSGAVRRRERHLDLQEPVAPLRANVRWLLHRWRWYAGAVRRVRHEGPYDDTRGQSEFIRYLQSLFFTVFFLSPFFLFFLLLNPFWTGLPLTRLKCLGCMRGPFVMEHKFYSFSSENEADSRWALTPA